MQHFTEAHDKKTFTNSHPQLPLAQSRIEHAALLLQATKTQGIPTMQRMASVLQKEYDSVGGGASGAVPSFAESQRKWNMYSNIAYMVLLFAFVVYFYLKGG